MPGGQQPTMAKETEVSAGTGSAGGKDFNNEEEPFRARLSSSFKRVKEAADKAKPYMEKLQPILSAIWPILVQMKDLSVKVYKSVQPYYDEDVGNIVLGLVLLFFGGSFAMTIACYQIFRASGQRLILKSWCELQENYHKAMEDLQKSPDKQLFDHDGDGKVDIWEIFASITELAKAKKEEDKVLAYKKVSLLMKCIDPVKIQEGMLGLWTGIVAILAALRSKFIRALTIGANLGKNAVETVAPHIRPKLYEIFPEHEKWVDWCLTTVGWLVGAILSLFLVRIINGFNSALEGAKILVEQVVVMLKKHKKCDDVDVKIQQYVIWGVALVGFGKQFFAGFSLPFILQVLLLPVTALEKFLNILSTFNWA